MTCENVCCKLFYIGLQSVDVGTVGSCKQEDCSVPDWTRALNVTKATAEIKNCIGGHGDMGGAKQVTANRKVC